MHDFEFLEPATVAEASRLLAELGEDGRVIAGGTALMLGMRQRMLAPTHLVSLARIGALRGLDFDPVRGLRLGALVRHAELAASPLVLCHYPVLAGMAQRMANPQVRNQGTVGGNLCYADPSTDPPGCLMALGAQIVLASVRGERVLDIEDFLVDYYATALEGDEIVSEIRVPPMGDGADLRRGVYTRFLRTAAEHRPSAAMRAWSWAPPPPYPCACGVPKPSWKVAPSPGPWRPRRATSWPPISRRYRTRAARRTSAARWCVSMRAAPWPGCSAWTWHWNQER
jgi:carbon-monoxide dehydrogenase medium subunit